MKKDHYRRWFADQLVLQNRLLIGAMAAMVGLGLIATLFELTLFASILRIGFVGSWTLAILITLMIQGGILFATWLRMPRRLADAVFQADNDHTVMIINVAPTMTAVWTYALGSLETNRSAVERLLGMLALPQRLFCAAWFVWQRIEQLKTIDVNECASVIRLVHKKAERVEVKEIADELTLPNLPATLRHVSLIDGVVFLTRRSVGLSLANRMVDDMEAWTKKNSSPE